MSWTSKYICHFVVIDIHTYLSKQTGSCGFLADFVIDPDMIVT